MSARFLKVKVKTLAAEARIIKREEQRCKTRKVVVPVKDREGNVLREKIVRRLTARKVEMFNNLRFHRVGADAKGGLRAEARNTLIAYAFVRGKDFGPVAPRDKSLVDLEKVYHMAKKYGPADLQNLPKEHAAIKEYEAKLDAWFGDYFKE